MANPSLSTRRSALRGLAFFGLAGVSTAIADQPKTQSPQERMAFHRAEFRKAAEEADPSIRWWKVNAKPHGGQAHLAFTMEAHRVCCQYSGDGHYYVNISGGHPIGLDAHRWTPRVLVQRANKRSASGEPYYLVSDDHSIAWGGRANTAPAKSRTVTQGELEAVLDFKDVGVRRNG
jgi:hypothetical protein